MNIICILGTILLIVVGIMYFNLKKETERTLELVGYKNAKGETVWGNDQRRWGNWQFGDPSYVLLSDRSALDENLKPCPPNTYGPTCEYKMCPTAATTGFYSYSDGNSTCIAGGYSKCNGHTGQCE